MTLLQGIRIYVERKRANGHLYVIQEKRLIYFSRQVGDVPLEQISVRQVLTFLDSPKISPMAWKKKHEFLRGFFDFWLARGAIKVSPMPPKRNATARTSIPYIYTQAEIQRLLKSARNYQTRARCIDSLTISTFLIFLYATGCLPYEAMQFSVGDVDLKKGAIFIRNRSRAQLRELPIGSDLKTVLGKYLIARRRVESSNDHFFLNKWGEPLGRPTINKTFQRIRIGSGIFRRDDAFYQPRMQDLRQHADSVVMPIVFDSPSASPRFRLGSIGRTAVEVGIIRVVFSKLAMRPEGEKTDAGEVIRTSKDR